MDKKILIAIDDSPTSMFALEYAAYLFAESEDVEFIILNCQWGGDSILPEPENSHNTLLPEKDIVKTQQKCSRILDKARKKLQALGVAQPRIATSCQITGKVAGSIQQYAETQLADSIIVSRRGIGLVGEILLGSVSSALFDKCHSTPLWIIDGNIQSKNFFIPVDGTPASLMAIDHLAYIFANRNDIRFYFFHARGFLSPPPICKPENFYDRWGKNWCDTHLSGTGCFFTGPTQLLTNAGIPTDCIETLPEPTALEESTAIISNAKRNQCGTIVIGRRPANEVKGILGGVAKRTVIRAENLALWLIG